MTDAEKRAAAVVAQRRMNWPVVLTYTVTRQQLRQNARRKAKVLHHFGRRHASMTSKAKRQERAMTKVDATAAVQIAMTAFLEGPGRIG